MSHIVRDHPFPIHHPPKAQRKRRLPSFWRHFLQMLAAMAVGMIATGAIFVSVVGLKSWDQVTLQYPAQALLAMAAGMTIPMVAWMLFRGMGARNSAEMAAAMVLPVIPFLCLVWFHVTKSAQCGGYCVLTIVAMLGLMFYRRSQYSATQKPSTSNPHRHRNRTAPSRVAGRGFGHALRSLGEVIPMSALTTVSVIAVAISFGQSFR